MGAKLSSIAQFTARLDDVVIIDEHTIVREQVALRILFELKIVQKEKPDIMRLFVSTQFTWFFSLHYISRRIHLLAARSTVGKG